MAMTESFWFEGTQSKRLYGEVWHPKEYGAAKGIIQIAHGMRESTAYYSEFCEALAASGYKVYIHDARGHGRTAGEPFSPKYRAGAGDCGDDAINLMAEDLSRLTEIIHGSNPTVPVFLLGHSMGSIISRVYACKYGEKINGLIYSGTAGPVSGERIDALLCAAIDETKKRGPKAAAVDTPRLLFANYNDRFEKTETGFEYMSRDEVMVRRAITSPYAAVPYRCGFYIDFLSAIRDMGREENLKAMPKHLPILSVSGDMDPFGDYGIGVPKLFELYRRIGIADASYKLYKGGRHEMLREINRREVFDDIISWVDRHIAAIQG